MKQQPLCAVLIAGPTGSGKSRLALELAEELNGAVINADSMQVYRELRIITARPAEADETRVPHRLYGFRPVAEPYSVGLWLQDVALALTETAKAGQLPIVTGGTGLYFKALTGGLSQIPPINPAIRAQWRERVGAEPAALLHAELSRRDPDTALKLHPTDTQRIIRALEVLDSTGKTLAHWQSSKSEPLLTLQDTAPIVLMQDRNELYLRCDERFEAMLDMGALAEAETLLAMNLDRGLPALRAVGLPPLLDYLQGKSGLNDAVERAKTDTRHYVKRQITWLNRNINLHQLVYTQFNERTKDDLLRFIRQRLTAPQKRFTHHPPKQKA